MQIFVKTLTNKKLTVKVDDNDTIEILKNKIEDMVAVKPDRQRLIFCGKHLENDRTISSYKMKNGMTVYLVLRIYGGG